jgi:hypothetical protein
MKYVNLRLPDDEHARMVAAAKAEFIPLTAYLRKLFLQHEQEQAASAALTKPAAPKLGKREQALAEYAAIMDDLPAVWNQAEYDRVHNAVMALRVAGGNIPHTETPLPKSMVRWYNAHQGYAGLDAYDGMSFEQLDAMVTDLEMRGESIPKMLDLARRMVMPDVPL